MIVYCIRSFYNNLVTESQHTTFCSLSVLKSIFQPQKSNISHKICCTRLISCMYILILPLPGLSLVKQTNLSLALSYIHITKTKNLRCFTNSVKPGELTYIMLQNMQEDILFFQFLQYWKYWYINGTIKNFYHNGILRC